MLVLVLMLLKAKKEVGTIRKWLDKIKEYAYTKPKNGLLTKLLLLMLKAEAYKEKQKKWATKLLGTAKSLT